MARSEYAPNGGIGIEDLPGILMDWRQNNLDNGILSSFNKPMPQTKEELEAHMAAMVTPEAIETGLDFVSPLNGLLGTIGGVNAKNVPKWLYPNHPDGKKRFEIDDSNASFYNQMFDKVFHEGKSVNIDFLLNHENLLQQYPELGLLSVKSKPGVGGVTDKSGVRIGADEPNKLETLMHELQHSIQDIEGFSPGGDTATYLLRDGGDEVFDKYVKEGLDHGLSESAAMDRAKYKTYMDLGGEQEARIVERRMNMSDYERNMNPFWHEYDFASMIP